jgi:acetyltransferase
LDETSEILKAYGILVAETVRVVDEEDALRVVKKIGYPVVLKMDSELCPDKLQSGGVLANLRSEEAIKRAFMALKNLGLSFGDVNANVVIQPMIIQRGCELFIGAKRSANFGMVIVFGPGGEFRGATRDYSVGLPPLNQTLARRMMEETGIYQYLHGLTAFKDSLNYLEEIIVRFSQLVVDFPQIQEININPLLLTEEKGIVLDARIKINDVVPKEHKWDKGYLCPPHLSIPSYPYKYERQLVLHDGTTILLRPIRGEDEPAMRRFIESLSDETIISRFGQMHINMSHEQLVRFCQIDYDRDIAFIAVAKEDEGEIIGDVRINKLPDLESAELSFIVSDRWQGKSVGKVLMDYCIEVADKINLKSLWMEISKKNFRMKNLGWKYGFKMAYDDEDMIRVVLDLTCRKVPSDGS